MGATASRDSKRIQSAHPDPSPTLLHPRLLRSRPHSPHSGTDFGQSPLQIIDHRPHRHYSRNPYQPDTPKVCVDPPEQHAVKQQETDGHHLCRGLELANHVHCNTTGCTDLRHPLTQCRNGNFTPDDDEPHKNIRPPQMHQYQYAGTHQNLSATGSRNAPKADIWLSLRARNPSSQSVAANTTNMTWQSGCGWPVQGKVKDPTINGIATMRVQVMMVGMVQNMPTLWHATPAVDPRASMQCAVNFLRQFARNAFHRCDVVRRCQSHTAHTAKSLQQARTALWAHAGISCSLPPSTRTLARARACR
jgi:hypothetical protein